MPHPPPKYASDPISYLAWKYNTILLLMGITEKKDMRHDLMDSVVGYCNTQIVYSHRNSVQCLAVALA